MIKKFNQLFENNQKKFEIDWEDDYEFSNIELYEDMYSYDDIQVFKVFENKHFRIYFTTDYSILFTDNDDNLQKYETLLNSASETYATYYNDVWKKAFDEYISSFKEIVKIRNEIKVNDFSSLIQENIQELKKVIEIKKFNI